MSLKLYRITFQFEGKYVSTPPSNVFVQAPDSDTALELGDKAFRQQILSKGFKEVPVYNKKIFLSSNEEVQIYSDNMKKNTTTNLSVN